MISWTENICLFFLNGYEINPNEKWYNLQFHEHKNESENEKIVSPKVTLTFHWTDPKYNPKLALNMVNPGHLELNLLSRNCFSISSPSNLDLKHSDPKYNPKLGLHKRYLHIKFVEDQWKLWTLEWTLFCLFSTQIQSKQDLHVRYLQR